MVGRVDSYDYAEGDENLEQNGTERNETLHGYTKFHNF